MPDFSKIKDKIQGLIDRCNNVTQEHSGHTATSLNGSIENMVNLIGKTDVLTVMGNNTQFNASDDDLLGYREVIVSIPEAIPDGYVQLPSVNNPADSTDVASGKEFINADGAVQMGSHECNPESDGIAEYFSGNLAVGSNAGEKLQNVLTEFRSVWRALMNGIGHEQNYIPTMIVTTSVSTDKFQGAWYAADGSSEFLYIGHNFQGGSTLQISYDSTSGNVISLSLIVDGTTQTIPAEGLGVMYAFFYPVSAE